VIEYSWSVILAVLPMAPFPAIFATCLLVSLLRETACADVTSAMNANTAARNAKAMLPTA